MMEQLQLRHDVVLVLLADPCDQKRPSGVIVEHALTPMVCYGRVLRTGPDVEDVAKGDLVAFPPSAGDPFDHGNHHLLFVREREIAFVLERP